MNQKISAARTPSDPRAHGGLSEVVIFLAGLGIVIAGIWTLYMSDAPYHPEAGQGVTLAAD